MIYKNKRTGAIITTDVKISGGDWHLVEEKKKPTPKKKAKKDDK